MELINQLSTLLTKSHIDLSLEQKEKLILYVNLIAKWNKVYNLTSIKDPKDMLQKHLIDSLVISKYLAQANSIADIGTGAGLPGIPLAIANPNKKFLLLDSRAKRTTFLTQVKIQLKLDNIEIVTSRVENYKKNQFDVIISRAFSSIEDFYNLTVHLCHDHSDLFALKGKDPTDELSFVQNNSNLKVKEVINLNIPDFEGQRHLVILEKI